MVYFFNSLFSLLFSPKTSYIFHWESHNLLQTTPNTSDNIRALNSTCDLILKHFPCMSWIKITFVKLWKGAVVTGNCWKFPRKSPYSSIGSVADIHCSWWKGKCWVFLGVKESQCKNCWTFFWISRSGFWVKSMRMKKMWKREIFIAFACQLLSLCCHHERLFEWVL